MEALENRLSAARTLWQEGDAAYGNKDYESAYQLYTEAHDLIMDCAAYHRRAHQKLISVTAKVGNYGEYLTDWLLLKVFYYVGIFKAISYVQNKSSYYSDLCKHAD